MNLILIPLEGVSQLLFWQYREAMPRLWELSNRSAAFRRFYTTSTSALQSFCDIAFGDSSALDHNSAYPEAEGCLAGAKKNLFSDLGRRGYETLGIQHGSFCPGYVMNNFWGAWPEECGNFRWHDQYDDFFAGAVAFLEKMKTDGKPFALYFSDRAALAADNSREKQESVLYHEWFEKGFALLDRSVGVILDTLNSLDLSNDTIVIIYGAYGMDPWKHGVCRGRTTALEPYADLCWTPLFVYRNGFDVGIPDQLVSAIDLRPTIMRMLFPQELSNPPENLHEGIDIFSFRRATAFSQNLFSLERENEGAALGLVKSYAATDGNQRLIVSSDNADGNGGMELYYDPRDPGNTRNFLDFFTLDGSGYMTAFGRSDIIHPHFTLSFKPHLVVSILNSYNTMREHLYGFVRSKEQGAMERAGEQSNKNQLSDEVFTKKRKRK